MARSSEVRQRDSGKVDQKLSKTPSKVQPIDKKVAARKATGTEPPADHNKSDQRKPSKAQTSKLPLVSVIDDRPTMDLAKETLQEAIEIQARQKQDKERLDELKATMINIAVAYGLPGMKWGRCGFEYRGERSNKTLSKERLLEHGVDPEIIADSYEPTKAFIDCRFVPLD